MKTHSLTMRKIFACMMENGCCPTFEDGYILFDVDDNTSVLEYENGVLTLRTFFTIDKEGYEMFLEASNYAMIKSYMIKPVIMEDMKSIMFSCETFCDNIREFRKFLPHCIHLIDESIAAHKKEMKKLVLAEEALSKTIPASDDWSSLAGNLKSQKILS
jgi:hypothetical protein